MPASHDNLHQSRFYSSRTSSCVSISQVQLCWTQHSTAAAGSTSDTAPPSVRSSKRQHTPPSHNPPLRCCLISCALPAHIQPPLPLKAQQLLPNTCTATVYRSISPNTTSSVPMTVTTSASIRRLHRKSVICRWAKPGERIFTLQGQHTTEQGSPEQHTAVLSTENPQL